MIFRLFGRDPRQGTIEALYGAIVAQARQPAFYRDDGVPDTLEGRFDMVVLHLVLAIRRLNGEGAAGAALAQGLFDRFCRDLDGALREMGVGDLAVPRKMRGFGEAFYGRAAAYEAALAEPGDAALAVALGRNVYAAAGDPPAGAGRLAAYVRAADAALAAEAGADVMAGRLDFPPAGRVQEDEVDAQA